MSDGFTGRILRVDLTSGGLSTEQLPEKLYRQFFGGEGLVGYFLLREVPAGVEPLGPNNKLVFAAGPLTGAPVGGCGRHSVGGKSPLTGGFGEAEAGGYWGAELRMAGFDAVVVEGKAESPVYLYIRNGQAAIRDARHLWGMKTKECQEAIRAELADDGVKIAQIGPAGENLVRFACVVNDLDAFAGRTGMGAVMGSKNLKAVACRGQDRVPLSDPRSVAEIAHWVRDNAPAADKSLHEQGTASIVRGLNRSGGLPTRNFQQGCFEGADNLSGRAMRDTILVRRRSCFACPVQCKREVKVDQPVRVDPAYGGPEYETIAALGSNCGVGSLKIVAKGHELTAAYGLDSISCGSAIAFAMECAERGILSGQETGGIDLKFGNGAAMLEMIERIARRQGLGDTLAEGVARASKRIGRDSEQCAMHVRGQEMPMHEPRWKQGLGVGYLVSPTGADHCHNMHDSDFSEPTALLDDFRALGVLEPLPVGDLSAAKMRLLLYNSLWIHFLNSAVCCYFVMVYGGVGFRRVAELVTAVTSWNTSVFELMKVGERAATMAQVFNLRQGIRSNESYLPARFLTPQVSGPLQGAALNPGALQKARNSYYEMLGWPQGVPSNGKLMELGLEWASPAARGK